MYDYQPYQWITDLPVSAMPTTSKPASVGGHEHAWIGVGSLKLLHAARSPSGTSNWSKARIGVTGEELVIVIECFSRNALVSEADGGGAPLVDEDATDSSETASEVFCFFCFLSCLDDDGSGSAGEVSSAGCLRFFLSFFSFLAGAASSSTVIIC